MHRVLLLFLLLAALPIQAAARIAIGQGTLGNVFVEGDPIAMPVYAPDPSLRWRVHDFFGAEVASGQLHPSGGTAAFRPDIKGTGYFILNVTSEQSAEAAEAAFAIVPRARPAAADSPFGVMTHFAKGWPTDITGAVRVRTARRERANNADAFVRVLAQGWRDTAECA